MKFSDTINNELYHVTTYKNAINILKYNYFRPSKGIIGKSGLSTTTDKNYWWGSKEVRFIIDKNKISKKYKLIKINEKIFTDDKKRLEESEIKILSNEAITDINNYIKRIEYISLSNKEFKETLENYSKEYNIEIKQI